MRKGKQETCDILDDLVSQFTDPMCFLRELVQNSLDAGSSRIEITFELLPGATPRKGVMVIHVDDWGEGMNREVIDGQLTRLFSSSKEGDLTKIGKFGIGFVSVFALDPDAVIVDTGRDGESWRLVFNRDRTFERIVRHEPVEGTKIQVIRELSETEFAKRLEEGKKTVSFWCRHAEADIFFQGARISEEVSLPGRLTVRHEEAGTVVLAGYTKESPPFFGFYNKGLTLMEGRRVYHPHVAFKVSSRYLEHTLTRDRIIQDENYEKAMAILKRAALELLPARLFDELEKNPRDEELLSIAAVLFKDPAWDTGPHGRRRWIPTTDGRKLSPEELRRCTGEKHAFYFDDADNAVTRALSAKGITVFLAAPGSAALELLAALLGVAGVRASEAFILPSVDGVRAGAAWRLILDEVKELLGLRAEPPPSVLPGSFDYEGSSIRGELFVRQEKPGTLSPRESGGGALVINASHPHAAKLLAAGAERPHLAAYLLAKLILLAAPDEGIDTALEGALLAHCVRREEP